MFPQLTAGPNRKEQPTLILHKDMILFSFGKKKHIGSRQKLLFPQELKFNFFRESASTIYYVVIWETLQATGLNIYFIRLQ